MDLPCSASGIPQPHIHWLKEGDPTEVPMMKCVNDGEDDDDDDDDDVKFQLGSSLSWDSVAVEEAGR